MRFTITKKIASSFIIILILMLVAGTISIIELNNAQNSIEKFVDETQKEKTLCEFQSDIASLLIAVNDFVITGDSQYYNSYNDSNIKVEKKISELNLMLNSLEERQKLEDVEKNIDSMKVAIPRLFDVAERKATDSVDLLINKLDYNFDDYINEDVTDLIKLVQANVKGAYTKVTKDKEEAFTIILIVTLFALIISIVVIILTMKRISKPILRLIDIAQRIAARDFSVEMHAEAKDEIGMLIIAFNAMVDEIGKRYEELENFSYIAAHDLKSPLTSVIGSAEILIDVYKGKISNEDEQLLQNIMNSGKRMSSLIGDLLNFATAGQIEFSKESVSVNKMLTDLLTELDFTIKKQNVELIIQKSLPSIICDPARLSQVWSNLISNSIKYNDKPEPRIEIGIIDNKQFADEYCFYVKDNGIGIDENYLQKIFNPFQRATTDKKYEGTGIGLAIVKRIIEFHRGKVWVESKINEGSTFYFTIPKQLILK